MRNLNIDEQPKQITSGNNWKKINAMWQNNNNESDDNEMMNSVQSSDIGYQLPNYDIKQQNSNVNVQNNFGLMTQQQQEQLQLNYQTNSMLNKNNNSISVQNEGIKTPGRNLNLDIGDNFFLGINNNSQINNSNQFFQHQQYNKPPPYSSQQTVTRSIQIPIYDDPIPQFQNNNQSYDQQEGTISLDSNLISRNLDIFPQPEFKQTSSVLKQQETVYTAQNKNFNNAMQFSNRSSNFDNIQIIPNNSQNFANITPIEDIQDDYQVEEIDNEDILGNNKKQFSQISQKQYAEPKTPEIPSQGGLVKSIIKSHISEKLPVDTHPKLRMPFKKLLNSIKAKKQSTKQENPFLHLKKMTMISKQTEQININDKRQNLDYTLPTQNDENKGFIHQLQRNPYDTQEIDQQQKKKKKRRRKSAKQNDHKQLYEFYYSTDGKSHIFTRGYQYKSPFTVLFYDSILPFLIVLGLHSLIWAMHTQILKKQYLLANQMIIVILMISANVRMKFWSFFRQLILYKLSHISYKRIVVRNINHERAFMEGFLLYFIVIGIDIVSVMIVEINNDIVYLVLVFCIGILVPTHMLKFRNFCNSFWEGRGLWLYDISYVLIFLYIYTIIPFIYKELLIKYQEGEGKQIFIYLYPIIEVALEIYLEIVFNFVNKAEFFMYQVQLLVLGFRVGLLICISPKYFMFWYLLVFFVIKRLENATQVMWIGIRRIIFNCCQNSFTSLGKYPIQYRAKNGAYVEHQIYWIAIYFWLWNQKTYLPFEINGVKTIENCQFDALDQFTNIPFYRPLIVYGMFLFGEATTAFLNDQTGYDMIKYVGAKDCTPFDNIMTGWYFFQLGLIAPMTLLQYNDQINFLYD